MCSGQKHRSCLSLLFFLSMCLPNLPSTIFSNISKKYLKYEHSIFTAITLVHATITSHLGFCNSLLMNLSVSIVAHSASKWFICKSHYINPLRKQRLTPHSEKSPNALLWSARPIWFGHCLSVWHPLVSTSLFLSSHTSFCSVLQTCIACSQFQLLCERFPPDFCTADFSLIMSQIKSHLLREAFLDCSRGWRTSSPLTSLSCCYVLFYSRQWNSSLFMRLF